MYTHIIEAIVVIVIILTMIDGWKRGMMLKLYGLIRLMLMIVLTVALTPILYSLIKLEPGLREGVSVLAAFVLSIIVIMVIASVLKIVDRLPVLHTINHIGGALVGLIFGVLTVWVALVIISSLTDIEWCKNVVHYVKASPPLKSLLRFDPIKMLIG
ncbi:MAG TPA: hypothetical protein DCP06_04750 [Lachnospiraceae bacterium]|nr:hypothetical protein [Lachnospiraceae bacterium]